MSYDIASPPWIRGYSWPCSLGGIRLSAVYLVGAPAEPHGRKSVAVAPFQLATPGKCSGLHGRSESHSGRARTLAYRFSQSV